MMSKKRYLLIPLVLILVFAAVTAATSINLNGAAAAEGSFVKSDGVTVAQITDTHYFPLAYCEPNPKADIEKALLTGTKLFVESSLFNAQGFKDVIEAKPDYLVLTGDITLNGEVQAHLEIANLLRQVQNEIRKAKPAFQIFVCPGNHDLYNEGAARYDHNGIKKTAETVTRKLFSKIYASLGYPDLSDSELTAVYGSVEYITESLPYDSYIINSTTAAGVEILNQFAENTGYESATDYSNGELSYIAKLPDNRVLISVDEEISGENFEILHYVGGKMYQSTYDFLDKYEAAGMFENKSLFGIMHHNVVPHFGLEGTLLKDFTIYNYVEVADYFADLGVRYMFTGHMHSNDIVSAVSLNGNPITDIETTSLTGHNAAIRYCLVERGTVDGVYAEKFSTKLEAVSPVDVTKLFTEKYIDENYLNKCGLTDFVTVQNGKYIVADIGDYAVNKLFLNIMDTMVFSYLQPDFILGLADTVKDVLPSFLSRLNGILDKLIINIIRHVENVTLKDYTYGGDNDFYRQSGVGYKLTGYLDELVDRAINIPVTQNGMTLFDFGMGGYLAHVGGENTALADADPDVLEAIENFRSGKVVKVLLDTLLDKDNGLYPIIKGLTEPIDLNYGMNDAEKETLAGVFSLFSPNKDFTFDGSKVVLDDHVPHILPLLKTFGIDFSLDDKKIMEFLDHTLESYVTESLYIGLGEIAAEIMDDFYIDETYDGAFGKYTLYLPYGTTEATFIKGRIENAATVENGRLPGMLTVTFGENPATDKNFVWFTDRRITGTDIQYSEGEFNDKTAKTISGEYKMYATTTACIDLGVFSTLLDKEIGRHSVNLTGLKSNTKYTFRVGSKELGYWSKVYEFKTAPTGNEPFEALLLTDIQGFSQKEYANANDVLQAVDSVFGDDGYSFVINCGDIVDNSRNLLHYEYLLNTMEWGGRTQVVSLGNHEKYYYEYDEENLSLTVPGADVSEYNYTLLHYNISYPEQDARTGAYYSFDYSGVHFTVLNTNDTSGDKLSAKQLEWLKQDLDGTDKKFKVVLMHKGIYTAGAHSYDSDVKGLRNQLTSVFAEKGVQLVLQGHDHTYTESYYLDAKGKVVPEAPVGDKKIASGQGVLYVNLGTLGGKYYNYVENPRVPIEFGKSLHNPTLKNPTFGKLYYDGENLYYTGYQYDRESGKITEVRLVGVSDEVFPWWGVVAISFGGTTLLAVVLGLIGGLINRRK